MTIPLQTHVLSGPNLGQLASSKVRSLGCHWLSNTLRFMILLVLFDYIFAASPKDFFDYLLSKCSHTAGWERSLSIRWPLQDTNVSTLVCRQGLQFTYNPSTLMWRKYIWKSFGVAFDCLSEAEHKRRSMMAWRKSYNRRCRGQPLKARIHFGCNGLPGSLVKTQFLAKGQRKEENIPSHLRRGVFDRKIISF